MIIIDRPALGSDDTTVSVVVTTYNHAHFLADAIESILAQSRRADEIVVVDDGSTDSPERVVAKFPGVRIIHQANQGLSAARNTGLKASTGAYILFLDADDRLTEIAIETGLRTFARHPENGFVYAAHCHFGTNPDWTKNQDLRRIGPDAYGTLLSANVIGMHATVLYRRDLLAEIGGFDVDLPACEDYDVYLRLARVHGVACDPSVVAEYRQHNSNMSANSKLMLSSVLCALEKQTPFAASNPAWIEALRTGRINWFQHYCSRQFAQLKHGLISSDAKMPVLLKSAVFFWHFPMATTRIAGRKVARRVIRFVPKPVRAAVRKQFGFRCLRPAFARGTKRVSTNFGYDRGKPLDRRYIDQFLAKNAADIHGRVLEIGDKAYTEAFGGDRVTTAEAFHRFAGHPGVTYVGDLSGEHNLPDNTFDCMILTQTLHLIFDMPAAIDTIWRALKPGGVTLITTPWISPIDKGEWGETWYWALSPAGLRKLLQTRFSDNDIAIESFGNALSASAFLYGLAEHEVQPKDLDVHDPLCPVIVAARARKSQ
ncbi:MAG TPA: glycosyltransferase [Hyphomicrobiaceae bacterium]|nr:glycosyltransferase [Hyphomicrobiaceae bacterium]